MSEVTQPDDWYELTRDIREQQSGGGLSVGVRFYYDVGGKIVTKRFNFGISGVSAESEEALERELENCWEYYKPNPVRMNLVKKLKGKKKVKD